MTTLSLLSRGCGQVFSPNQRLEVHFEPEDYFNWKTREGLVHVSHEAVLEQGSWRHSLHKTYTTRRGSLVLYAEDLALPSWKLAGGRKSRHRLGPRKKKFEIELRTLRDLAGAILSYGRKQKDPVEARWQPYLHFLSEQDSRTDRQMHPGYSAKRYLSCLSQTWDPSTVYRLQCAGSIRDPAVLQTTAPSGVAPARRQQDLSAAPAQYHLLPVMSSIHDLPWTEPRKRNNSGQCSPVLEEQENEEELQEGSEENGWRVRVPAPSIASRRTLGLEATPQHERLSTRNEQESYIDFLEVTPMEFYHSEEHSAGENQEHVETQSKTRVPSFGNISFETSPLQTGKSHTTFYGGQFSGRKKSQNVKQGQTRHQDDKEDHTTQEPLPDGGFLPPISSTQNTDHGGTRELNTKQVQETLKLPPISEELPRAQPPRKRRTRASEPPKELLVLPLLVQFQGEENEKAADEEEAAHESSKSEFTASEILGPFPNDPVQVALPEGKVHSLQMDINWNPENHPDALPVVPPLGRLPPLNRKKGPGNQSSNAKASSNNSSNSSSNNNSNNNSSRGLPTGTIRGTLPEELRDFCKGSSVGSLIMGPDGEIICLSLLGSAQDTDIPVQLDFLSDGAHLSLVSEASQEEEWPGIQQSQLQEVSDQDRLPSIYVPTEARDSVSYSIQEEQNTQWIDSEDTVALSNDRIAGTLDKKHADREGAVKNNKSPPPPEETFDDTPEESVKKTLILPQKTFDDTLAPSEPSDEGGVMSTGDSSVTAAGLGNAERPEEGNVQDSEQYIVGTDTEETDPTPQEEAPPVLDALPGPGSSTQPMLMEPQTETAPDAVKQPDGESARDMPQQKEGEPKSVNVLPARPISTRTVKETLRPGPSDSRAVASTKSTVQQEIGGSMAPESVPSAGVQTSLDAKQPVAKDKELAVLEAVSQQPIPVITEKGPTKSKGKSKPKNEKIAKQPAAPKETKKDKEKPKGKAVFVVGKPKQKKSEEKLEASTKQESTNEMSMEPKIEVVKEKDEEDNPTGSAIVRYTEPDITVSPASRGSTPFRPPSEEPQLSEIPLAEEQQLAPVENPKEIVPENQVKGRETSAHPSISISLLSGDTASEMSESNQGSSRQDKSSRDKLRAEQAEKRRLEVERKRREREEQKRAEQEKLEREEQMKEELEREQQRRAEEMRLRKQQLEEEQRRKEQEALRKAQLEKQAQERARQQQEEYRRKMQELQRRKQQEERERAELEEKMKLERERALAEERQRLQGMAESERQEYYRHKQEEEERARREEEERRQRAEEQRRLALEEAQRQAQLFARERAALERQLNFQRELLKESIGMDQSQDISRPWVFSYFQLLEMLGLQPTVEEK